MSATIPKMSDDWFPDDGAILVQAKDGDNELGFAITKESYLSGRWKVEIEPSLKALLFALWQTKHMSEEDKIRFKLKEPL